MLHFLHLTPLAGVIIEPDFWKNYSSLTTENFVRKNPKASDKSPHASDKNPKASDKNKQASEKTNRLPRKRHKVWDKHGEPPRDDVEASQVQEVQEVQVVQVHSGLA